MFHKKRVPARLPFHTDLHAHILPGIDDGSPDPATSIALLRQMQSWGITRVYATPHVAGGVFENTPESIAAAHRILQENAAREGLEMEIYCSAEYRIDDNFRRIVDEGCAEIVPLPGDYVLVEHPFRQPALDIEEILFRLKLKGYTPILAHPERYYYYHHKKEVYPYLHESGCLFQTNLLSLAGYYGKEPRETALWLYKNGLVDFLGSDLHRADQAQAISDWLSSREYRQMADRLAQAGNDTLGTQGAK